MNREIKSMDWDKKTGMKISLENWIRNKLQETEEMLVYSVGTDTVRCWIDEYNELSEP